MQSLLCHTFQGLKHSLYPTKLVLNLTSLPQKCLLSTYSGFRNLQLLQNPESAVFYQQNRSAGFLGKKTASELWKSSTSVSNQGLRRGRGRKVNASLIKDLNRGQVIGCGEISIEWPGLNAPVFRGSEKLTQRRLPDDPDRMAKIIESRTVKTARRNRIHPLERGFTSAKVDGMTIKPEAQASRLDTTVRPVLNDFTCVVLHTRVVSRMMGPLGRSARWNVLVGVGNSNGLVGIGRATKKGKYAAVLQARARAQQKLLYIERFNNHSVLHDFWTQFGRSKIEVRKQPEGHGLKAQRVLSILCRLVGIKDIKAKIHGTRNVDQNVKAFLLGLINQKSHQTIADEVGLNIVEIDPARHNYPKLLAAPEKSITTKKFEHEAMCDFSHYTMEDRIVLKREPWKPFYTRTLGWQTHLLKIETKRNQDDVRRRLKIKYGKVQSFLAEKYPEAVAWTPPPRRDRKSKS